jgi:hypothetical protein
MDLKRFADSLAANARHLACAVREILPDARRASSKPMVAGHVLLTAIRAQIALAILLVFLIFVAPIIVDGITGILFPPETSKKVFGLLTTQHENPLKGVSYAFVMTLLWTTSMGTVLLLLWFHIPEGLVRAESRARRLVASGDDHADRMVSRRLYQRALSLTTDPQLQSEIQSLLQQVISKEVADSAGAGTLSDSLQNTMVDRDVSIATSRSGSQGPESRARVGTGGRYSLGPELGRGAMGVVYRGWDNVLDREVALKQLSLVLAGDEEYASRFRREAKMLARMTHPNIVQVYDLIETRGRLWMALEFVDGGDFATYLRNAGRLSVSRAADVVLPVTKGLAYAHGRGLVHRDLKPANILLTSDLIPKISDFGIAKLTQSSGLTQVGSILGSPRYMSPEQCSGGSVDARTDLYALGITLYEVLTGKVPFEGETSSVLARQIAEQPRPLSEVLDDIPADLERLIMRLLAKNPDERPADLTEVIDLLASFKNGIGVEQGMQFRHIST